MVTVTCHTALGAFDSRGQAEQAVQQLLRAGFGPGQIGFLTREAAAPSRVVDTTESELRAESGAAAGALTGGLIGVLLGGVAVLSIPALGPVLAAGLLAGVAGGGAAGAWSGGLVGALVGLTMPEEEARHYEKQLGAGRSLVFVQAGDRQDEATAILTRCGGRGLDPSEARPV